MTSTWSRAWLGCDGGKQRIEIVAAGCFKPKGASAPQDSAQVGAVA
jgi:hypothetical protein